MKTLEYLAGSLEQHTDETECGASFTSAGIQTLEIVALQSEAMQAIQQLLLGRTRRPEHEAKILAAEIAAAMQALTDTTADPVAGLRRLRKVWPGVEGHLPNSYRWLDGLS